MKIKLKLFIGFSIMVALTIFLGIITNSQSHSASNDFVMLMEHDLVVLQNAERLSKLVADSESGARGFIISGDESFLERYSQGLTDFDVLIEIEKDLVSDNPEQVQRLEHISELFSQWVDLSANLEIELARQIHQTQETDLELLLSSDSGKVILDDIRDIISTLKDNMRTGNNLDGFLLLTKIDNDIADSESAQRGYLVSGKDEFLILFETIKIELHENIQNLEINLSDDDENLQLIYSIDRLYQQWEQQIVIPEIDSRKLIEQYPSLNQIALITQEGTGKKIIDEIKLELNEFIEIENDLTKERFGNILLSQELIRFVIFTVMIISIVGALILTFLIFHSIASSLLKLEKIIQKFKEGNYAEKIDIVSNDELGEFSRSFDSIRGMLLKNEKLQNIGDLASRLAHDLRNPLSIIDMCMKMLESQVDNTEKSKKYFKMLNSAIKRMTHQLNDVMDFVRVTDLKLENISLLDVLKSTLKKIDIPDDVQIEIPQNDIKLKCDPIKLDIVFINLILNALEAINAGKINIRFFDENSFIKIEIEDSGPEIPLDVMNNMFEPLFTTRTIGTGLGLASCKSIVEQHKGKISIKTNPTVITIILSKNL